MSLPFSLGDLVIDKVSGIKGIAIGRTTWLYGCERVTIQPVGKNEHGGPIDAFSVDTPQIEVIKAAQAKSDPKPIERRTGGPMPVTGRAMTPSRR